ncbi:MAG: hypothetical protein J7M18_05730 [Candidatus Eremiobacteraeota bacterium]|nr:hypothetical protein [Candidatus Eremiobacteraeota bacterium]
MSENLSMFYSLEEELGMILSACEKLSGDIFSLTESQAMKLLNFRDDLQSAIENNPDLEDEWLERIEKFDRKLESNLLFVQSLISREFIKTMREVYSESHWWWY